MEQLSLFEQAGKSKGLPEEVLHYTPSLFDVAQCAAYLKTFISTTPWQQREVTLYGKKIITPRLTAWYGDPGKSYTYSGNRFHPLPWTTELLEIKNKIEPLSGIRFNSVLLNYYRGENDSVAWHSDNERELGKQPVVASVSFGQGRHFDIRKKSDHNIKYSVLLEDGSLLLMKGDLQENWQHRIAKSIVPMKPRINLTFRIIKPQ